MPPINEILKLLEDGTWHDLREITEKSQSHDFKVKMITSFLAEYGFIELDKERQKAKLTYTMLDFLKKIRRIEEEEKAR